MKSLLMIAATMFVSSLALAEAIKVDNQAGVVRIDSVSTEIIGQGFPSVKVTVNATFSNPCMVPKSAELVSITQYSKNYDQLLISLGQLSMRMCPAVYKPTPATIELGTFTRPNDGLFDKIIVNGAEAKK